MRTATVGILVFLLLSITSARGGEPSTAPSKSIAPVEAIQLAADDPPHGVTGVFEFEVRRSGRDKRFVYLGSEKDYRDQRCLTVKMTRGNATDLGRRLGLSVRDDLIGKRVRVRGTAKREQIHFTSSGRPTGLYYYQTHIFIADPNQIQLLDKT